MWSLGSSVLHIRGTYLCRDFVVGKVHVKLSGGVEALKSVHLGVIGPVAGDEFRDVVDDGGGR